MEVKKTSIYHGMIIKSPKANEMIKGPMFSLTDDQSRKIINYFKTRAQWDENYISDNLSLVPPDILFDTMKIFPIEFKDLGFLYDFDIFSLENFFSPTSIMNKQIVKSLNCYSLNSEKLIYSKLLGSYTTNGLLKFAQSTELENENIIPVSEEMVKFIQHNKYVSSHYQLNLSNYNYFIENVSLYEYLILKTEDLFLDKLTHMPLCYIDR